jgi:carbon storage regulator CsrA
MLVLSRRLHEKIVFPGLNITVQVLSCKAGVVRLGIEAPPDIPVVRNELVGRIRPQESRRVSSPQAEPAL